MESDNKKYKDIWPEARIIASSRCNLKCLYCSGEGGGNHPRRNWWKDDFSQEHTFQLVSILRNSGIEHIHLTGGEPTLNKNWYKIVNVFKRTESFNVAMTTNGLLFYEKILKELPRYLDEIHVHYFSKNKSYCQKTLGENYNPQTIIKLIERSRYSIVTRLDIPVTKQNINELSEILDWIFLPDNQESENKLSAKLFELLPGNNPFFEKFSIPVSEIENELIRWGNKRKLKLEIPHSVETECGIYLGVKGCQGEVIVVPASIPCIEKILAQNTSNFYQNENVSNHSKLTVANHDFIYHPQFENRFWIGSGKKNKFLFTPCMHEKPVELKPSQLENTIIEWKKLRNSTN
ncbi:radical SAM protein [candidate division KSB1 bacterium]